MNLATWSSPHSSKTNSTNTSTISSSSSAESLPSSNQFLEQVENEVTNDQTDEEIDESDPYNMVEVDAEELEDSQKEIGSLASNDYINFDSISKYVFTIIL